jgi:hypothetical protein
VALQMRFGVLPKRISGVLKSIVTRFTFYLLKIEETALA